MALVGAFLLLIVVVGGVGMVVALVSAAWVAVDRSKRVADGETHRVCAECGYPTRGLATSSCPECGSDLGEHSVIVPARGRLSYRARLILIVLISATLGVGSVLFLWWGLVMGFLYPA